MSIYSWQTEVWQRLVTRNQASVERDHREGATFLNHALLLRGRKGLGKFKFANCLAKSRLCQNTSVDGEACGSCASCRWFEQGGHPDFRLVEPEVLSAQLGVSGSSEDRTGEESSNTEEYASGESSAGAGAETGSTKSRKKPSKQIGVEQIRALTDFINISSHQNGYKIIVIHPAETMNTAAANALLKNLEEPPPRTLFILVAHQAQHLLATIRSRCMQVAMPAPDSAVATRWLRQQGVKNAEACLASAGYAPLAALEFNDDIYLEQHSAFIEQISELANFNPIALAEAMQKSDLPTVVKWLQKWCYDLLIFRTAGKIRYHVNIPAIPSLASDIDPRALITYLRTLTRTQQLASHPLNPRLFLEEMLFSYAMMLSSSLWPASKR
ncbi:DNA polymerase III subunit delta' [Nitrosovibrio tenuis]|uniref:DNA polymerase III subunit delta' n=1 Tax=Nitrosovibrio tenuis TaxID=1233 RepID=A0A1H7J180_9PROT|nr:DNA polymerase III subunit delta' [Nitrosovibrio tenuis]SEK67617.1 DNA polymerase III, delta prime subunit [Nitrosovibrio tenuis]